MPAEAWWALAIAVVAALLLWRLRRARGKHAEPAAEDRDGDPWDDLSEGKDPTI